MIDIKKLLRIGLIGVFLIIISGCSDHGHSHDENGEHSHTTHETIG